MKGGAGSWFGTNGNGQPTYNIWTKGSPALDPFRATQFDLSYEHYFEDEGVVSVAAFYKDIGSLVEKKFYGDDQQIAGELAEAAGYSLPTGESVPDGLVWGAYETFANTEGGYIRGVELAGTKVFSSLPGALSGLGATASYSYTESETSISPGSLVIGDSAPLPGLSKNVWSTTLFWDLGI